MDLTTAVRTPGYLKLLVIAGILGFPFGVIALAFVGLIHEGEKLVFSSFPSALGLDAPPLWLLLLAPLVGGLLAGAAVHYLPGNGGHGPLVHTTPSPVLPSYIPGIVLAALAGLSFGVVLGPEAPLIGLAMGLGGLAAHALRQGDPPVVQLLGLTAVFSMVSALFGGPIVAAILIIETVGIAGTALTVAVLPALLAAGTGYLAYTGFGDWSGIDAPVLVVPDLPADGPITWGAFFSALVIGVVGGALCVAIRRVGVTVLRLTERQHPILVTAAAGLVVGLCAVTFQLITGAPGLDVLTSGQEDLTTLASSGYSAATGTIVALLLLKSLAYAVSLGGGFRGGPIFPALFLGTVLGVLAVDLLPGLSPLAGFAAGMAAGTAGMMRVPLSALVLVTVMIGPSNANVLPLVLVSLVASLVVATRLDSDPPATIAPDAGAGEVGDALAGATPTAQR